MRAVKIGLTAVLAAGSLATGIGTAGAAQASTTGARHVVAQSAEHRATGSGVSGAVAAACSKKIVRWGYTGYRMCGGGNGYHYWDIDWNRDRKTDETFVIAPNRQIWHVWNLAGRWQQMPGNGRGDRFFDMSRSGSHRCVSVVVNGAGVWRNKYNGHKWGGWARGTCY